MTREEFINNVNDWYQLIEFCSNEGLYNCDDIYSEDGMNDIINDELTEMASNGGSWQELRDTLNGIPSDYDYYLRDDYGDWSGADCYTFDEHKEDVLITCDDACLWDEEEEEDPLPTYEEDEEVVPEPISLQELTEVCHLNYQQLSENAQKGEIAS